MPLLSLLSLSWGGCRWLMALTMPLAHHRVSPAAASAGTRAAAQSSSSFVLLCASPRRAGFCWAEPWQGTGRLWVPGMGARAPFLSPCPCSPRSQELRGQLSLQAGRCCPETLQGVGGFHLTYKPHQLWVGNWDRPRVPLLGEWCWAGLGCLHPLGAASQSTAGVWAAPEHPQGLLGKEHLQVPWGSATG